MLLTTFTLRMFLRNYYHNIDAAENAALKSLSVYKRAVNKESEIVKSRIESLKAIIRELGEMRRCNRHQPKEPSI